VGLPNGTLVEETDPGQGHVKNRFACPSPNMKRPRTCLTGSEQMTAKKTSRGSAIVSPSSVEKDSRRDEEASKPYLVTTTSSALVASYPDQEDVQEEAEKSTHYSIPSGPKRVKRVVSDS
jgi:hypothetical protein